VRALLRPVWDEARPDGAPARVWRDWVLVGVVIAAAVLEGVLRRELPLRALSVVVTVALGAALLWRRTRPLAVIAMVFGALGLLTVITAGAIPQMYSGVYVLLFPYALLRWGSGREIVLGVAILVVKSVLSALPGVARTSNPALGAVVLFAAMALGAVFRLRAGARLRELDRAKLLERERLARDLHDTVAHHVSAIAIRAQAGLAMAAATPEAPVEALRVIEAEASRTLAEMRAMVRVLRRDDQAVPTNVSDLRPSPSVADLERLPGLAVGAAGPPVDLEISGDVGGLPDSVGTAIYRLVQEAVTNARRHARHATRIEVRIAADESCVRVRVSDDGDMSVLRNAAGTPGYGLIGMIERARLLGGSCEAGPSRPGHGWAVTAVLPRKRVVT
jgi:signal transduction histidine kinase